MNLKLLKEPFKPEDIEWRVQRSGIKDGKPWAMVLAYVTNRAIMDRLDDVCGPENWRNEYKDAPGGGILCGISIQIPAKPDTEEVDGSTTVWISTTWITKWDGAEQTDIEAVKGGLSSAMKRAAVQWGIGRYLYNLDAMWAIIDDKGIYSDSIKDKQTKKVIKWFKWNPPGLPGWALPAGTKAVKNSEPRQMTGEEQYNSILSKLSETHSEYLKMAGMSKKDVYDFFKENDFDIVKIIAKLSDEIKKADEGSNG